MYGGDGLTQPGNPSPAAIRYIVHSQDDDVWLCYERKDAAPMHAAIL